MGICSFFIVEENISQEFRLKTLDETRNYLLEEIEQNELMSRKHKKVCAALIIFNNFLFQFSAITGSILVSSFASLLVIPIRITSSAIELKNYAITTGVKKYNSIFQKQKMKHDKIVLLTKSELNNIEVLISKAFFQWKYYSQWICFNK